MPSRSLPVLRTTERGYFHRCDYKWWWGYREGLKKGEMPTALWFGIGMHMALATYYGPGKKRFPKKALAVWKKYCEEEFRWIRFLVGDEDEAESREEGYEVGRVMLEGYFEEYKGDPHWHVIQTERPFQLDVIDPATGKKIAIYAGTYDGVLRDLNDDSLWLMEHKNFKAINLRQPVPVMDPQCTSYIWVATTEMRHNEIIGPNERIEGVLYNILRKGLPDSRPQDAEGYRTNKPTKDHYVHALDGYSETLNETRLSKMKVAELEEMATTLGVRVLGERSANQPPPLFHREKVYRTPAEIARNADRVVEEIKEMNRKRTGKHLLKNPTRDCSWDCTFFDMCTLHEQGADWEMFRDGVYHVEDPYADHRKSV